MEDGFLLEVREASDSELVTADATGEFELRDVMVESIFWLVNDELKIAVSVRLWELGVIEAEL